MLLMLNFQSADDHQVNLFIFFFVRRENSFYLKRFNDSDEDQ